MYIFKFEGYTECIQHFQYLTKPTIEIQTTLSTLHSDIFTVHNNNVVLQHSSKSPMESFQKIYFFTFHKLKSSQRFIKGNELHKKLLLTKQKSYKILALILSQFLFLFYLQNDLMNHELFLTLLYTSLVFNQLKDNLKKNENLLYFHFLAFFSEIYLILRF